MQLKRRDNLGEFVRRAAVARDSRVTRDHFIGTLPRRRRANVVMLDRIYVSSDSAEARQRQAREACTKNIGDLTSERAMVRKLPDLRSASVVWP